MNRIHFLTHAPSTNRKAILSSSLLHGLFRAYGDIGIHIKNYVHQCRRIMKTINMRHDHLRKSGHGACLHVGGTRVEKAAGSGRPFFEILERSILR